MDGLPEQLAQSCRLLASAWDTATGVHGVADAGAARMASYPFLGVNRYLAVAIRDGGVTMLKGVEALADLDRKSRKYEWANLPATARVSLGREAPVLAENCRQPQMGAILSGSNQGVALASRIHSPCP